MSDRSERIERKVTPSMVEAVEGVVDRSHTDSGLVRLSVAEKVALRELRALLTEGCYMEGPDPEADQ